MIAGAARIAVLCASLTAAACGRQEAGQAAPKPKAAKAAAAPVQTAVTPMAQRVAVLGFLNKRNGIVRDITLKPGQAVRIRDAVIRLRACETSAPWENPPLTGAFVQLDTLRTDGKWVRAFSGWLYKESPSLNVVEHPVYDVWPKSCAMKFPDGPAAPAGPRASSNASSAKKSGGGAAATAPGDSTAAPADPPAAEPAVPSAAESNAT